MSLASIRVLGTCFLVSLSLAGCDESSGPEFPSRDDLAGAYVTVVPSSGGTAFGTLVFSTTENGVTVDRLARGAQIRLTLAASGATSGTLLVPDVAESPGEPADFVADLDGAWTLTGTTVTLDHEADTFLRDMPLTVRGDRLEGDRTFGDVRVRVVLQRQ